MKRPIKWHKEGLKNSIEYVERKKRELTALSAQITQYSIENVKLQNQIDRAEREGKIEFDAEKYLPYPKKYYKKEN